MVIATLVIPGRCAPMPELRWWNDPAAPWERLADELDEHLRIWYTWVGESVGIRIPGAQNKKFDNPAPCFLSGRTPLRSGRRMKTTAAELDSMMDERFATYTFTVKLPMEDRRVDWKHCGRCAAAFYAQFANFPAVRHVAAVQGISQQVAHRRGTDSQMVQELLRLQGLHEAGVLNAVEFSQAKSLVLGLGQVPR